MQKATDYIGSLIIENDTLQFIQTAEGRVVPKTVDGLDKNEYQYHLKDHLGNVRSTFAVRDDDYSTGFETLENPYFDNYDEITILPNQYKRSGSYSHRLAGGGTNIVGLMKTLYVSKGDKISAEVYGKYLNAQIAEEDINGGALINALVTMLGGGTITGEGTIIQNNLNTDFLSAALADDSQESSPKAYLNYILLDKNFNYLTSGFDRLSSSAADPGDGSSTHQKLSFEEITIEEDGYLMVFLSNESKQSVEVFWDDFKVSHHFNAVLQADDYYPFGLTFNSYQRSYSKANNYKYNGFEEQVEWGVYDYQARYYDPALGRFLNVDPAADLMRRHSPYNYAFDNPIRFIDPDGMMPSDVVDPDPVEGVKMWWKIVTFRAGKNYQADDNSSASQSSNKLSFDEWMQGNGESQGGGIPLQTGTGMPSESTKTTAEKTEAPIDIDMIMASSGGSAGKFSGSDDPSVDIANSLSKVAGLFGTAGDQKEDIRNKDIKFKAVNHAPTNENEVELDTISSLPFDQYPSNRSGIDHTIVRKFYDGTADTIPREEVTNPAGSN